MCEDPVGHRERSLSGPEAPQTPLPRTGARAASSHESQCVQTAGTISTDQSHCRRRHATSRQWPPEYHATDLLTPSQLPLVHRPTTQSQSGFERAARVTPSAHPTTVVADRFVDAFVLVLSA